jgi:hypothetical protein
MLTVTLRWPGTGTLQAARRAIRGGDPVEIELPLETHYALCRHLHPERGRSPGDDIDAAGDAELLEPIAAVAGLEDLRALQTAVRRAHYRVRLRSPEPRLTLTPPGR